VAEESSDAMRFRMLETLREFAAEQLPPDKREPLARRHLEHLTALAETIAPGVDQVVYMNRMAAEQDNVRAALEWGMNHAPEAAMRLATAMGAFWLTQARWVEGLQVMERCLAHSAEIAPRLGAKVFGWAGVFAYHLGDFERGQSWLQQSLACHEQTGNPKGALFVLYHQGIIASLRHDYSFAQRFLTEALDLGRQQDNQHLIADCLAALGRIARDLDYYDQALHHYEESLTLHRQMGNQHGVATQILFLGELALLRGEREEARRLIEKSLALFQSLGDIGSVGGALGRLGEIALAMGDVVAARAYYVESLELIRKTGSQRGESLVARMLAKIEDKFFS
jgi:tetratricopeptide (TPR) repeat protein